MILACRSDVFGALLYGGMREANERDVRIPNIEPAVFRVLLEYIYTGKANITGWTFLIDPLLETGPY